MFEPLFDKETDMIVRIERSMRLAVYGVHPEGKTLGHVVEDLARYILELEAELERLRK